MRYVSCVLVPSPILSKIPSQEYCNTFHRILNNHRWQTCRGGLRSLVVKTINVWFYRNLDGHLWQVCRVDLIYFNIFNMASHWSMINDQWSFPTDSKPTVAFSLEQELLSNLVAKSVSFSKASTGSYFEFPKKIHFQLTLFFVFDF